MSADGPYRGHLPMSFSISFTAAQIADHLHGEVVGDGSVRLTGFAPADSAKAGDLTFAEKPTYFAAAEQSAAALSPNGEPWTGHPSQRSDRHHRLHRSHRLHRTTLRDWPRSENRSAF